MIEAIYATMREGRKLLQVAAEPIDWASRWMNNKVGYPPLWVRQKVGGLNDFEGSGGEYMAYLKLLCDLKPGIDVLDIGCGCGLMCLRFNENGTLPEYIQPGEYWGVDIDETLINWCEKNIIYPYCFFVWLPTGSPQEMLLRPKRFDVILAKSLFTHLPTSEMLDYIVEIKKVLKPGGKCLTTFFLLNGIKPKGRYTFRFRHPVGAYERESKPRLAVAYDGKWLLQTLEKAGFSVDVYYGSWRGNNKGLSFQDIIILRG